MKKAEQADWLYLKSQKGEGTFDLILKDSKKDKRKVMEISLEKIKIKEGRFSKVLAAVIL